MISRAVIFSQNSNEWKIEYPRKEEDHYTLQHFLSCLPFFGAIPFAIGIDSVEKKIDSNLNNPEKVIDLLIIKKEYLITYSVSCILSTACIVTALAFQIISTTAIFEPIRQLICLPTSI